MRDIMDFDVLDENLITDGALEKYKVLIMTDGNFLERETFESILAWITDGGILFLTDQQMALETIEGEKLPIPKVSNDNKLNLFSIGEGNIYIWNDNWDNRLEYYNTIHSVYNQSLGVSRYSGIDGKNDGVWTTLFKNRLLFYNHSNKPISITENISTEYANKLGLEYKPEFLSFNIEIPGKSVAAWFLDRPFYEFVLECEKMRGANNKNTIKVNNGGPEKLGRAVKLRVGESISISFETKYDAIYGFVPVIKPEKGAKIILELNGKKIADCNGPAGYHNYMYPIIAKELLTAGKHKLIIKVEKGEYTADKVIITTDTQLAGFAWSFFYPDIDQSW